MAQDQLYAEIVEHEGRRFLFWLERDGDRLTFHQVTTCPGFSFIDVKAHIRPVVEITDAAIWARLTEDGFPALCARVLNEIRGLEEAVH